MNTKAKLATILRRMADRLAPAPAGDCQSGTMWLNLTSGGADFTPPIIFTGSSNTVGGQIIPEWRFRTGGLWTPA